MKGLRLQPAQQACLYHVLVLQRTYYWFGSNWDDLKQKNTEIKLC